MRLTCPNCGAQYEVDASAIPAQGRDVQCSSCGHGWFQKPTSDRGGLRAARPAEPEASLGESAAPADQVDAAEDAGPTPNPASGRNLDPAIAEVLRAEAEREAAQRRKETADLVEEQQELALPDAGDVADQGPDDAETGTRANTPLTQAPATFAQATRAPVPRRDLLPDIEEINSSLRAKSAARAATAHAYTEEELEERRRRGRGFRLGFSTVLLIALFAVLAYAYAPLLARTIPPLEPSLTAYVMHVNDGRVWVNGQLLIGTEALNAVLSSIGG